MPSLLPPPQLGFIRYFGIYANDAVYPTNDAFWAATKAAFNPYREWPLHTALHEAPGS